jgi:hypothetical protein
MYTCVIGCYVYVCIHVLLVYGLYVYGADGRSIMPIHILIYMYIYINKQKKGRMTDSCMHTYTYMHTYTGTEANGFIHAYVHTCVCI